MTRTAVRLCQVGLLPVLAALWLSSGSSAAARDRVIDRYGGGGTLRSPDGRWTIWSKPTSWRADDIPPARAYLRGPGVSRFLMRYDRLVEAVWAADRRHVLVNLIDINWQTLEVHTLTPRAAGRPRRIQADIDRQMIGVLPLLQRAEWQRFAFGRIGRADCVAVEQDGTPKGADEGSFIARTAAFRLDHENQRAIRIARCPGAKL